MALKNKLELCLSNQITELQNVNMQLEQFGELWNLPFELVFNLNLVLEEVLSNIIFYGYDDSAEHTIELNIELQDDNILIKIVDDAKAFNPLERTDPDVTQELESRQIGGLGIFLVKKIMTEAEYFRKDNKNILILKKSVKTR